MHHISGWFDQFLPSQVQIRPWNLADSDYVLDDSQALDPRKTIFVGGVPRPLRASMYNLSRFLCESVPTAYLVKDEGYYSYLNIHVQSIPVVLSHT